MSVKKVAIAWWEPPHYAAAMLASAIARLDRPVPVVATPSPLPIEGVTERLGQEPRLVDPGRRYSWAELGLEVPDLLFQSGWAYPVFNHLGDQVRARGGRVVSCIDNRWKNNPRQWLGALYYRLFLRKRFAAVWVPGRSGLGLMRFLGVRAHRIYQGLNGADPDLFTCERPLRDRPKRFLFVGQLIHRKGVDLLLEAFRAVRARDPEWELIFVGSGPYADQIHGEGIRLEPYRQVDFVARLMRESRFLVLPAREEHWGMVAHEAALAGCGLVLSDRVGAVPDITSDANCYLFDFNESKGLKRALRAATAAGPERLDEIERYSRQYAALYGPRVFADTFERIVAEV